jgi:hypothetical protein
MRISNGYWPAANVKGPVSSQMSYWSPLSSGCVGQHLVNTDTPLDTVQLSQGYDSVPPLKFTILQLLSVAARSIMPANDWLVPLQSLLAWYIVAVQACASCMADIITKAHRS